jgi:hypothetical protein
MRQKFLVRFFIKLQLFAACATLKPKSASAFTTEAAFI